MEDPLSAFCTQRLTQRTFVGVPSDLPRRSWIVSRSPKLFSFVKYLHHTQRKHHKMDDYTELQDEVAAQLQDTATASWHASALAPDDIQAASGSAAVKKTEAMLEERGWGWLFSHGRTDSSAQSVWWPAMTKSERWECFKERNLHAALISIHRHNLDARNPKKVIKSYQQLEESQFSYLLDALEASLEASRAAYLMYDLSHMGMTMKVRVTIQDSRSRDGSKIGLQVTKFRDGSGKTVDALLGWELKTTVFRERPMTKREIDNAMFRAEAAAAFDSHLLKFIREENGGAPAEGMEVHDSDDDSESEDEDSEWVVTDTEGSGRDVDEESGAGSIRSTGTWRMNINDIE
jgi:hypothetical protein